MHGSVECECNVFITNQDESAFCLPCFSASNMFTFCLFHLLDSYSLLHCLSLATHTSGESIEMSVIDDGEEDREKGGYPQGDTVVSPDAEAVSSHAAGKEDDSEVSDVVSSESEVHVVTSPDPAKPDVDSETDKAKNVPYNDSEEQNPKTAEDTEQTE